MDACPDCHISKRHKTWNEKKVESTDQDVNLFSNSQLRQKRFKWTWTEQTLRFRLLAQHLMRFPGRIWEPTTTLQQPCQTWRLELNRHPVVGAGLQLVYHLFSLQSSLLLCFLLAFAIHPIPWTFSSKRILLAEMRRMNGGRKATTVWRSSSKTPLMSLGLPTSPCMSKSGMQVSDKWIHWPSLFNVWSPIFSVTLLEVSSKFATVTTEGMIGEVSTLFYFEMALSRIASPSSTTIGFKRMVNFTGDTQCKWMVDREDGWHSWSHGVPFVVLRCHELGHGFGLAHTDE